MAVATGAIALPVGPTTGLVPGTPTGARSRSGRRLGVAAAAAVLIAVAVGGLRLAGFEWFVVTTPSMGTAVPVGAMVVDAPVSTADLRTGDVISFTPPGAGQAVHTHRIVAVSAAGLRTRGDANAAADPWMLPPDRVRGRVVAVLPGLGWLMRALPLLLVGGLVTWGAVLLLRRRDHRAAAVLLGASLSVSAASLAFRPFVNAVLISATAGTRSAVATVVSTGMLPVRVSATTGGHVDLAAGQVGVLRSVGPVGRIDLEVGLHLPPAGWAVVVGLCALPLIVPFAAALRGRRR